MITSKNLYALPERLGNIKMENVDTSPRPEGVTITLPSTYADSTPEEADPLTRAKILISGLLENFNPTSEIFLQAKEALACLDEIKQPTKRKNKACQH